MSSGQDGEDWRSAVVSTPSWERTKARNTALAVWETVREISDDSTGGFKSLLAVKETMLDRALELSKTPKDTIRKAVEELLSSALKGSEEDPSMQARRQLEVALVRGTAYEAKEKIEKLESESESGQEITGKQLETATTVLKRISAVEKLKQGASKWETVSSL